MGIYDIRVIDRLFGIKTEWHSDEKDGRNYLKYLNFLSPKDVQDDDQQ